VDEEEPQGRDERAMRRVLSFACLVLGLAAVGGWMLALWHVLRTPGPAYAVLLVITMLALPGVVGIFVGLLFLGRWFR